MTTPSAADTKRMLMLAERMGIPVDEAMRQLARVIADAEDPIVEQTIVLSAETAPEPVCAPAPPPEREQVPELDPTRASVG